MLAICMKCVLFSVVGMAAPEASLGRMMAATFWIGIGSVVFRL